MNIPVLSTPRLKLRAFTTDDLEAYAEMYTHESFFAFIGGKQLSKKEVWINMATIHGHWQLLGYGIWALENRESGELVGRAGLLNLPGWPDIEVCWALGPDHWGHGYATEAAQAAVDWAFKEAKLKRLISLIHPENKASEAVALRIGETFCENITFDGKPTQIYEVLNPAQSDMIE